MKRRILKSLAVGLLLFCCTSLMGQTVFINEIHYDNAGTDVGEAIEIAGVAGTNLSGWSLVFYNGSNGAVYGSRNLATTIDNQQNGYGTVIVSVSGLQNGAPDGIALVDNSDNVIQFLSYEGVLTAVGGPADGMTSTDIGVAESSATPIGASLSLVGEGLEYDDFSWEVSTANTFEAINTGQSFGVPTLNPIINEFVCNHDGSDTNEFIEIYAPPNTDLSAFSLLEIEGDNSALGTIDEVITLGTTDTNGYYTTGFLNNALENGTLSLLLVENFTGSLGDDLDTDDDGALDVMPWERITDGVGVHDGGTNDMNYTAVVLERGFDGLSLTVGGASRIPNATDTDAVSDWVRNDFDGQGLPDFPDAEAANGQAVNTPARENEVANVVGPIAIVINELDADTAGTDTLEFVELFDGGTGNTTLNGLVLVLYNGNNDNSYRVIDLTNYSTNSEGYFVIGNEAVRNVDLVVPSNTFQNGADAVALYAGDAADFETGMPVTLIGLVDAIVYDTNDADDAELLVLLNDGEEQLNESIHGDSANESLQRIPNGAGGVRNTSSYEARTPTPGAANDAVVNPGEIISIAAARAATDGDIVTVTGILTAADNFGGPAFIQDASGGIAIFDEAVHGDGVFAIGDSLTVTGTRTAFNGLVQISPVAVVEKNAPPTTTITPQTITLSQLGDYPGELVRIANVNFPNPGDLLFGNSNFTLTDASGAGQLRVDFDVTDLVGLAQPASCAEVIGVVGRFNDTFQLLPRIGADVPCAETFVPPGDTLGIPKDDTFDIVAWNIEWFGNENNAPPAGNPMSDAIQRDSVLAVLAELDADVYTVEEIADDALFEEMVGLLPGYDFVLSDAVSYPAGDPPFQKVGFIYKTETVNPIRTRALLKTIHPSYNGGDDSALVGYPSETNRFYASGRLPFLMTADVTINGVTEQLDIIALHARANSSNQPQNRYDMRKFDVEVLKDSLDAQFADRNVILLGDYNDDVDETVADVSTTVSSFESYVADADNYTVITEVLSEQGFRSFVSRENMIDHITFTNELSAEYINNSVSVHYEFYDSDYARTASDHFPVSARFKFMNAPLEATVTATNVSCNGANDGAIALMVTGGVPPYTYMWSDGQDTETATGLPAGDYAVIIQDAQNSELLIDGIEITEPAAITYDISGDTTVYLGYAKEECATLFIQNIANTSETYDIVWSTGETGNSITVCPKEDTVFTVTVTDAHGCSVSKEIKVTVQDVSCGNNPHFAKVQVCYKGKTLCLPPWTAERFIRRGAKLGSCDGETPLVFTKVRLARNPVRNTAQVSIKSTQDVRASFVVYDFYGRKRLQSTKNVRSGKSIVKLNVRKLGRGIYFLKPVVNGEEQKTLRFVK